MQRPVALFPSLRPSEAKEVEEIAPGPPSPVFLKKARPLTYDVVLKIRQPLP